MIIGCLGYVVQCAIFLTQMADGSRRPPGSLGWPGAGASGEAAARLAGEAAPGAPQGAGPQVSAVAAWGAATRETCAEVLYCSI